MWECIKRGHPSLLADSLGWVSIFACLPCYLFIALVAIRVVDITCCVAQNGSHFFGCCCKGLLATLPLNMCHWHGFCNTLLVTTELAKLCGVPGKSFYSNYSTVDSKLWAVLVQWLGHWLTDRKVRGSVVTGPLASLSKAKP